MGLQLASMPPAVLTELLLRLDPISMSRCASTSSSMRALASAAVEQRRADLSRGIEPVAVRCENASDGEPFPAATYASVCFSADPRLCTAETAGCDCTNEATCGVSSACSCCAQAPFAYDEHGRLRSLDVATVIECGSRCHCDERCRNRVVSRGMRVPLVVFKSRTRGWGVRAEVRLERGQFVCEYAGQIISSAQAASRLARGGHNYVMTVREHTRAGQALVTTIDPTDCGNVGRFLNHCCEPNLALVLVRTGSFVPRVAFFCARDVPAGEELTFFYGDGRDGSGSGRSSSSGDGRGVYVDESDISVTSNLEVRRRQIRQEPGWLSRSGPSELPQRSRSSPSPAASRLASTRRPCLCGATTCAGFLPNDAY